jgi:hypothetical protein
MLHVCAAAGADSFVTFDKNVARQAGPTPPLPIETVKV